MPRRSSPFRRPTPSAWVLLTGTLFVGALSGVTAIRPQRAAVAMPTPAGLGARFDTVVAPFVKTYCLECHSGDKPEAELDLSTLTSMTAAVDEPRWGLVLEMLESGEMPADDARTQPTAPARAQAVAWFRDLRTYEVARNAGDPGVVLARRLSNAEYNYTIRDLTGVDIRPTREFPVDPAERGRLRQLGRVAGDVARRC